MRENLLQIKDLCLSHSNSSEEQYFSLKNITFDLPRHSSISIIGESGAGKTSLIMALMLLYKIDSGIIFYKDQNIARFSKKEIRNYQRQIQPVFQNYEAALNPRLNILKTLEIGMPRNFKKAEKRDEIARLLKLTELSEKLLHQYPHQLSGGEKQRVTIARALITRPEIVILDEPFSAIDVLNQEKLLTVLKTVQKEMDLSYLFITHKIPLVRHFSDAIYLISQGKFQAIDAYSDLCREVAWQY
jgi:peptide/nickel transport system ATP-binding protein